MTLTKGFMKTLTVVVMFSLLTPQLSMALTLETQPSDVTASTSENVNFQTENSFGNDHFDKYDNNKDHDKGGHNNNDHDSDSHDNDGDSHHDNDGHNNGNHNGHHGHDGHDDDDSDDEDGGETATSTSCYVGPITLTAASGTNQVALSWSRVGTSTASFTLERMVATTSFVTIASPAGSDTSYTDTNITANETYTYRISRDGVYSNLVNVITKEGGDSSLVTAPLNLIGTVVDSVSTELSWDEGWPYGTQPDGFKIERSGLDGLFSQIASTPFSQTYYDDETLSQGSSYFYRVQAYTGASTSPFTNLVNLITWRGDDLDGNGIIEVTVGEACPQGYGATTPPTTSSGNENPGGTGGDNDGGGTASTTPSTGGNGGNQSFSGSGGTGFVGNGGGSTGSTGQVLGAATGPETCVADYLTEYIRYGRTNDTYNVALLQIFLNKEMNAGLPLTGHYDEKTMEWVNAFQVKYYTEVLRPWVPFGLPTEKTPTGYVYKTTKRMINNLMCPSLNLPIPQLP